MVTVPNTIALKELETRWDYDDPAYAERHYGGILHRSVQALTLWSLQGGC